MRINCGECICTTCFLSKLKDCVNCKDCKKEYRKSQEPRNIVFCRNYRDIQEIEKRLLELEIKDNRPFYLAELDGIYVFQKASMAIFDISGFHVVKMNGLIDDILAGKYRNKYLKSVKV